MNNETLGYFITWTVYGTFLQGDSRWWSDRDQGTKPPQPLLERWHRDRLKHPVVLLTQRHRECVEDEIKRMCDYRSWKLWAVSVRTNHVHVVVNASDHSGKQVREQLKANCTRVLRKFDRQFVGRPVWTSGGYWTHVNSEDGLEQVIVYTNEAQDRMERGK